METKSLRSSINHESGVLLTLKKISPRRLYLSPWVDGLETKKEGVITSLNYENKISLQAGEIITVNKNKFKILKIIKDSKNGKPLGYSIYSQLLTKTSYFIFPLLGGTQVDWRWHNNYVNTFLGIEGEDTFGEYLYMQYTWSGENSFVAFEHELQEPPWYGEVINVDKSNILIKINIPEYIKKDVSKIISGKYSEISDKAKEQLMTFHDEGMYSPTAQIIYKQDAKRLQLEKDLGVIIQKNAELLDPIVPLEEIYLLKYKLN